ncbi:MAG: hypothetical protein M3Y03_04840 [Verrucomicrobiota bacterium]|nr:hypothetical protein [Verrucomicrobiota bacterium]
MKQLLIALALLGLVSRGLADNYSGDEDHSRFTEESYTKQAPGFLTPAAYIAIATKACHDKTHNEFHLRSFSDAIVTRRFYRNAPASDRDIIAVQFIYQGDLSGGGSISQNVLNQREVPATPVLQALIRKNGSKVYLNMFHYKQG